MNSAGPYKLTKSILALSFLIFAITGKSQNPFDYGNSDASFFVSSNLIDSLGFQVIYIVDVRNDTGGMNEDIDLTVIDFTTHHTALSDEWHACYDTTGQIPVLDSLISQAMFINGYYWNYEGDTLSSMGMQGYGTLCMSYYENEEGHVIAETMCKRDPVVQYRKIYYHNNGLPSLWTCCEWDDEDAYDEDENNALPPSDHVPYSDTTYLVYDSEWRYLGLKEGFHSDLIPVLEEVPSQYYGLYYQAYVDKTPMEQYVQANIGFMPKRILIEIYRKAALVFMYDSQIEKYVQLQTIVLE